MGGQVSPVMLAKSSGAGISGRRPQARRVWARAQVDGERSYMNMRCARWGVGGDVPEVRPVARCGRNHAGSVREEYTKGVWRVHNQGRRVGELEPEIVLTDSGPSPIGHGPIELDSNICICCNGPRWL